jgi:aquaporin Z
MPPPLPKRLAAEVVGTFGFFFTAFTGIAAIVTYGQGAILSLGVAAGFGFGLGLMIFAFGHVSGGHYNPAVTLGLAVARRFPASEVLPYWGAQIVGGIAASAILLAVFSKFILHQVVNAPGRGVSDGKRSCSS